MPQQLTVGDCPRCGGSEHVRPKLLATNFLLQRKYEEKTFTATRLSRFRNSPHTLGDHFVSGLFCDLCDLGFIPDPIAVDIGIDPFQEYGCLSLSLYPFAFGVGYPRADISIDDSGRAVRPFEAVIWQPSPDSVGFHVTIHASDLTEAASILKREHGRDVIFSMWNNIDADAPR